MGQSIQVHNITMSEKLCLKWNDFQGNISTAFGNLRNETEFSDVTLVCEDGQQVEAHKVILAASSPFFQNLLRKNKHPHPMIYMRGVKSEDLVAIVDFLYIGEANVFQDNLDVFLTIAEELKLKGLTKNGNENVELEEQIAMKQKILKPKNTQPKVENMKVYESEVVSNTETQNPETTVSVANYPLSRVNIANVEDLEETVKSMMTKSGHTWSNGRLAYSCSVCGKEGQGNAIKDHIEANHLEGVSIPCNFCERTFRSRSGLRQHNSLYHK